MKQNFYNSRLLAIFFIASLSGCANNELRGAKEVDSAASHPQQQFSEKSLSSSTAAALILSERSQFQSAVVLASQRLQVKQDISELTLGVVSSNEKDEKHSLISFSRLPEGLNYYMHIGPDLTEAGIDIFGEATLVYWNNHFPYLDGVIPNVPYQVRLLSGRMYSVDSAYAIELKAPDGEVFTEECVPYEVISASSVNFKLKGNAAVFHCKTSFGGTSRSWYLENYGRYVHYEIFVDGELQSRTTIKDVKFN